MTADGAAGRALGRAADELPWKTAGRDGVLTMGAAAAGPLRFPTIAGAIG
jgi:hypothetical protein